MTIDLTESLRHALEANTDGPVRVRDLRTNAEYVLIRAELYDQLGNLVGLDPRDAYPLLD